MTLVAIQGIKGSYSESAAGRLVPDGEIIECADFASVVEAVETGRADRAVLPLENKIAGAIRSVRKLLDDRTLLKLDEICMPVDHVLAGLPGTELKSVTKAISHPEALRQCTSFFATYPAIEPVVGPDTASSLANVVRGTDRTSAAIASRRAVELYGAEIIREDIADEKDNWTNFGLFTL